MFGTLAWSQTVARLFIVAISVFFALFLTGCPPTPSPPPSTPFSITITDQGFASPAGGMSFRVSGQGFTPNGQVNVRFLNAPGLPTAIEFANGPGLPNLVADANGNFSKFHVSVDCADVKQFADGPVDVYLHVIDVNTNRVTIHTFPQVPFCQNVGGHVPQPINCPVGSSDPRCR